MWEIYDHTADLGLRASGRTIQEAFSEIAVAMFSYIADIEKFPCETKIDIKCDGDTLEDLLVDFLNKLLTESAIEGIVFSHFDITEIDERGKKGVTLKAKACGAKINSQNKVFLLHEVKAATYHDLKVQKRLAQTMVQCVVDV
jgi:SHS2 domain-containing protein